MRPIRKARLRVLLLTFLVAQSNYGSCDPEHPRLTARFPEYDPYTACVNYALIPSTQCVSHEMTTRDLLLSSWRQIELQYEPMASTCVSIVANPEAAPASYRKLLECISGDLYADE